MESYDFTMQSIKKNVAFKGTQKNDVNMFCESDAPRPAIYISLGHRDTIFFLKITKKSKIVKERKSLYRQEVLGIHFDRFLVVFSATRDVQNDMFC